MTQRKYNIATASLCLVGWLLTAPLWGSKPAQEFVRKISRDFAISPNGTTAIYNKYGNVKVNTWANPSVKMDITIVVNAPDQRTAERTFDRIKVNFLSTADYVKAETIIEADQRTTFLVIGAGTQDYKIHYDVWLPANNQLDLKNRYGDAYVGNLKGKLTAEIRYGNLRGENLGGDADLSLSYGKTSFNQVRQLTGSISYADLLAERAADVGMDSRYSELRVTQANAVRLTSKYDKLHFGNIGTLRVQTRYSDLRAQQVGSLFLTAQYTDSRLDRIAELLDADLSYGQLSVATLGRHFSEARLQGKYTDIKIAVEPGTAFRLDAQGKHTDVRTPSSMSRVARMEIVDGQVNVSGFAGESNAPRIITARLQYGDFVLK